MNRMPNKRILFIMHSMPIGGAEKVLCDILDKFDYEQYDISLLLYEKSGELLADVNNKVKLLWIKQPSNRTLYSRIIARIYRYLSIDIYLNKRKINAICESKYDSIISFCQGTAHWIHTYLLNRSDNNISWIHSDLSVYNWGIAYFNNDIKRQECAYNQMNKLVFVSNDSCIAFNKVFKINKTIEQHVVYNFVNKNRIRELSKQENIAKHEFVFCNIGRLIVAKRQDRLIAAAHILKEEGFRFCIWIIGTGPLENILNSLIDDYKLHDCVQLIGSKKNPYPYLLNSDCFILTSQQEGFSIVIGEAFALGKPVISTKTSGPCELIGNNEYGVLVEQDVDAIANAMRRIIVDTDYRNYLSEQSLKRSSHFLADRIMSSIFHIL